MDLEAALRRVDAVHTKYQRAGQLLGEPFLAGQLSYDAYMARRRRISARMQRELDRIKLH